MASKGAIERNKKIIRTALRCRSTTLELKKIIKDQAKTPEERLEAQRKLTALGPFSRWGRVVNRCGVTGTTRSYSWLGIGRDTARMLISYNKIPCITKASW